MQIHRISGKTPLLVMIGALRLAQEQKGGSEETNKRIARALSSAEWDALQERQRASEAGTKSKVER
jgi:hypothetical protein